MYNEIIEENHIVPCQDVPRNRFYMFSNSLYEEEEEFSNGMSIAIVYEDDLYDAKIKSHISCKVARDMSNIYNIDIMKILDNNRDVGDCKENNEDDNVF